MKKTYIVPQTLKINVQMQHMIAVSGGDQLMSGHEAEVDSEVLSRTSNSLWEEEE
jgi:hypothetical protein